MTGFVECSVLASRKDGQRPLGEGARLLVIQTTSMCILCRAAFARKRGGRQTLNHDSVVEKGWRRSRDVVCVEKGCVRATIACNSHSDTRSVVLLK